MTEELNIKNKILIDSEGLFMKFGFKSITMDDIARELGISKKTLYQHFVDKNDLVNQCVELHLADINKNCDCIIQEKSDPIDTMISITQYVGKQIHSVNPSALFDLKKYFKPAWDKLDLHSKEYICDSIRHNIEQGQKKGIYRKDIIVEYVCKFYLHLIHLIINPEFFDKNFDMKKLHHQIITYHLRAICTAKGLETLELKLKELK